jgi:hypothetical protein
MPIGVSPDNFIRVESDLYFGNVVNDGGFGGFHHIRELSPIDNQLVIRQNRDTLYSAGVFDLDAGPLTIGLPDAGERFMSLQVITEDHYVPQVIYSAGTHTFTRDAIGTRYVMMAVRTLVDPSSSADIDSVHRLQDAITAEQDTIGRFEVPDWDPVSQKAVRDALLALASTLPDTRDAFGTVQDTDPVRHLICSASAWGGNPEKDALYLNVTPPENDGTTVYRVSVGEVPVDGFWSITVYNANGYFTANPQNAYSLNNLTSQRGTDGSVEIRFGGCDGSVPNCLPITVGWNYLVRLYRPRQEILNGSWTFPGATAV